MNTKKIVIVGVGVAAASALAWYLLNRNSAAPVIAPGQSSAPGVLPQSATASNATTLPKQTLFKDPEGNVFEITTQRGKYGFNVKVNGAVSTTQEVLAQGPDGFVVAADSNGSLYQYKTGKWNMLSQNNKTAASEYLAKIGAAYPALSGLGTSAYILQ